MKTAIQKLRDLWDAGDRMQALRLAASWPRLGDHKRAIEQGRAACTNPGFYRQIGKDPDALVRRGLEALADRYNLPPVHEATR